MYLASTVDNATTSYFCDAHEIAREPILNTYAEVLLKSLIFPPQSQSNKNIIHINLFL